jgi:hypothetical protein
MRTLGLAPVNGIEDTFSISYSWRQFLHMGGGGIENTHYSSPSYMDQNDCPTVFFHNPTFF